jgi:hypothetical protein
MQVSSLVSTCMPVLLIVFRSEGAGCPKEDSKTLVYEITTLCHHMASFHLVHSCLENDRGYKNPQGIAQG